MKRWLVLVAVLLPHCAGCLYYAYPTLTHTPDLAVDNKDGSVQAFRVDIDRTDRQPLPPLTQYTLSSIPIDARGLIPSQLELAAATGVYNPLGVVDGGQHERNQYTMLVRAYRPGYRTTEVKAWEKSRPLQWFPAPDILAQEKALDDLLAVPSTPDQAAKGTWWELKDEKMPGLGLQPGSVSPGQRKALEFAAGEYQRLARTSAAGSPGMVTVKKRLEQKAGWLSDYAVRAAAP
jgi:hypothetical protein